MGTENEFKSFLKTVGGNEGGKCLYPTRLDLYGRGCAHNCAYCYARSLLDFRGLWDPAHPAVADPQKVVRAIGRMEPGSVVRIGGMTDCFQPAEAVHRITEMAIRALNERRVHYLIVTKSPMVADDRYVRIMDPGLAHIQISVTSTDDALSRTIEQAPAPSLRIQAIEKLARLGFDVSVRLSPFIPGFIDFHKLGAIRCDKILVEFLRVNGWINSWLPGFDTSGYTLSQSGYRHLPLEEKIRHMIRVRGFRQVSVCEDVTEHYRYWKQWVNANPDDCCNLRK